MGRCPFAYTFMGSSIVHSRETLHSDPIPKSRPSGSLGSHIKPIKSHILFGTPCILEKIVKLYFIIIEVEVNYLLFIQI